MVILELNGELLMLTFQLVVSTVTELLRLEGISEVT